jgi:proton-coupled amino acid transporter
MLALGSFGRWLVDINILISQVGFCCAYLIFISENLHSVFPRVSQLVYLFSILLPLVFLCNLRHLKHLAPFSLFADFATIFAYGIVFYFDMEHFHLLQYALTTTKYRASTYGTTH